MKILVTGGTGFLGKASCLHLHQLGHQVTALGRRLNVGERLQQKNIAFVQADLLNTKAYDSAFSNQDAVVHCAALSSVWGSYQQFYNANVQATQNVIDLCLAHGVKRLIYISSPSIYFSLQHREKIRENEPLPPKPVNHYSATKRLAEHAVDAVAGQMEVITLRPQALFGPEDPAIVPRLIRANTLRGIPYFNGGKTKIDITYVENAAHAISLALQAPRTCSGCKYNITNDDPIELGVFLQKLFDQLNITFNKKKIPYPVARIAASLLETFHRIFLPEKEPVITRYSLGVLAKTRTLDISAARQDLGYDPLVSVEEGLKSYVEWYLMQASKETV